MLKIKRRGLADVLLEMGDEAYRQGDHKEAFEKYVEAFEMASALPHSQKRLQECLYERGCVFLQENEFYWAIKCFNKVLEKNNDHLGALMGLGKAYLYSDCPNDALGCFREGVRKNPKNKTWWYWLATTYGALGYTYFMLDAYWKILSLDPDDVELWCYLGNFYYTSGQYLHAANCYEQVLSLDADQKNILYALALTYRKARIFTSAIFYYDKIALLYMEEKNKALYEVGHICFYELQNYKEAFKYAELAGAIFSGPAPEALKRDIELLKIRAIAAMKGVLPAMQVPTKVTTPQTVVSTYCKLCVLGWGQAKPESKPEKASPSTPSSTVASAPAEEPVENIHPEQGASVVVTMK